MIPARLTRRVAFASRSVTGAAVEQTGLLHVPDGSPPPGGWPVVTYGHMTTGGGDRSAPSTAGPDHPEWRRMSQGDALCRRLLDGGAAVLRPDYEGIGSPGPHPYLVGSSLARSVLDMLAARRELDPRLGDDWVSAGHSEGAVAALHAAVGRPPPGVRLRGVAAFAPVTRMDLTIGITRRLRARLPGFGVLPALTGLMLSGAATTDPGLADVLADGGLSPAALALWPHLEERCLTEAARADSWGGLSPAAVWGPRGDEAFALLARSFRASEVAALELPGVPVRVDAALLDEVAPAWLTRALVRGWRACGTDVRARWWRSHHSGCMREPYAPSEAAGWILDRLAAARPGA